MIGSHFQERKHLQEWTKSNSKGGEGLSIKMESRLCAQTRQLFRAVKLKRSREAAYATCSLIIALIEILLPGMHGINVNFIVGVPVFPPPKLTQEDMNRLL
jgi:hypothetical protein